jgi:hypothetical protein
MTGITYSTLIQQAALVSGATQPGENTAQRLGILFADIIEGFSQADNELSVQLDSKLSTADFWSFTASTLTQASGTTVPSPYWGVSNDVSVPYTLQLQDNDTIIQLVGTGDVIIPDSLPTGFSCVLVCSDGTNKTLVATTLKTKNNRTNFDTLDGIVQVFKIDATVTRATGDLN